MAGPNDDRRRVRPPDLEITPPPREGPTDMAAELAPPPEEFPRPGTSAAPEPAPRKKRRLLRAFGALAAATLAVWLFVRPAPGTGAASAEIPAAPAVTAEPAAPEPTAVPEPTATPEPTPEPTATPEPTPTPPPWDIYPLGDGEIQITVFGDMINMDFLMTGEGEELVTFLQETIPESEFTEFPLPYDMVPESYDPFVFRGFFLHYGSQFDPGFVPGSKSFVVVLEDVLTREDVERVPPNDDGVRYVNIHVMWKDEDEFITDPSQYGMPLTLDDGMGHQTIVEAKNPLFSEGFTCLAIFPVPEREGYTFTGWYDEDGKRVEVVNYFQFYDEYESEWGVTMYEVKPYVLTAGWEPNG